ncbi:hypothetical protein ABZ845_04475 [Streptomyces sp. NPDC047022]|uniref:hypothetical protein n=1 Tax=Streptomyces sp. NPDC047022 TaxID=3155737 RepID=UPI0033C74F9A
MVMYGPPEPPAEPANHKIGSGLHIHESDMRGIHAVVRSRDGRIAFVRRSSCGKVRRSEKSQVDGRPTSGVSVALLLF